MRSGGLKAALLCRKVKVLVGHWLSPAMQGSVAVAVRKPRNHRSGQFHRPPAYWKVAVDVVPWREAGDRRRGLRAKFEL